MHDSNAEQREMGSMCCCSKLYTNYENIRTQIRGPKTLHMSRLVVTHLQSDTQSRAACGSADGGIPRPKS